MITSKNTLATVFLYLKGRLSNMPKYSALDIARWFINRNDFTADFEGGDKMTLLKLLKLLYYSEGCSLALGHGSLFSERILAWEHGPVVKEVWDVYKEDSYNLPFGSKADNASIDKINADTETRDILEQVFQVFGQYSAWALRNKTHEEEPWLEATNNGQRINGEISRKTIERYFKSHYIDE